MAGVVRYDMETQYGDFVPNDIILSQWADDVNASLDDKVSKTVGTLGTYTSLAFTVTTNKITRTAGSWITDNVQVGMLISIVGSADNDGIYTINSIDSGTVIDVDEALVTESAVACIANIYQVLGSNIAVNGGTVLAKWDDDNPSVTRYWSRGWRSLYTLRETTGFTYDWTVDAANKWIDTTTDGTIAIIPVHLPHGVTVTELKIYGQSNSSMDVYIQLYLDVKTSGDPTTMAQAITTTTMQEHIQSTISSPVIDNDVNNYYIQIFTSGGAGEGRIRQIEIEYTINKI